MINPHMYGIAVRYERSLLGAALDINPHRKQCKDLFGFEGIKAFPSAENAAAYLDEQCGWRDYRVFPWQPSVTSQELAALWATDTFIPPRRNLQTDSRYFWRTPDGKTSWEEFVVISLDDGMVTLLTAVSNYADCVGGLVEWPGQDRYALIEKRVATQYPEGTTHRQIAFSLHLANRAVQKLVIYRIRTLAILMAIALSGSHSQWQLLPDSQKCRLFRQCVPGAKKKLAPKIKQAFDLLEQHCDRRKKL